MQFRARLEWSLLLITQCSRGTILKVVVFFKDDYHNDLINKIAKGRVFSALDLKSAYHQIHLHEKDQEFTAFEVCGKLFQYRRLPFGVTNGISVFQ